MEGSILEKCGKFRKNGRFSGRIWPDWGNTAWADMAGLGSIGLRKIRYYIFSNNIVAKDGIFRNSDRFHIILKLLIIFFLGH